MPKFVEMDRTVTLADQLKDEGGAVVLVNTFVAPPEDVDQLLAAWAADAAIMKRQPGFISTQLHRGVAGSGRAFSCGLRQPGVPGAARRIPRECDGEPPPVPAGGRARYLRRVSGFHFAGRFAAR
jgi:hypothetical protein